MIMFPQILTQNRIKGNRLQSSSLHVHGVFFKIDLTTHYDDKL